MHVCGVVHGMAGDKGEPVGWDAADGVTVAVFLRFPKEERVGSHKFIM